MKKTILKVFLILAALLLGFVVWELFFSDTGIMHSAYNTIAGGVNGIYQSFAGPSAVILPNWGGSKTGDQASDTDDKSDGGKTTTYKIDNEHGNPSTFSGGD